MHSCMTEGFQVFLVPTLPSKGASTQQVRFLWILTFQSPNIILESQTEIQQIADWTLHATS